MRLLAGVVAALVLAGAAEAQPGVGVDARIRQYEEITRQADEPAVEWLLAEAYAEAGRTADAVAVLQKLAGRRMGFAPDGLSPLKRLAGDPAYDRIAAQLHADAPKVRRGRTAFTIARTGVVPEGIAYDARAGRVFVGDMHARTVLAVDRVGRVSTFAPAMSLTPLGMKVHGGRLWVATTNGFTDAKARRAELVAFDLRTGRRVGAWTHPEAQSFNDFDFAPDGAAYVSDSLGGAVFRLAAGRMERLTPAGGLGYPNGVAVTDDGRHVFVAQGVSLRRIDTATKEITRVGNPPGLTSLGSDGLYWRDGALLAVQNGGTPGRVVRFRLSPERDRITGFELLEAGNPAFDVPTTAAIGSDRMYVLANAQIDRLREDGRLDPAKPLHPIQILEIPLG
ncbi:SMP-30/gluconolactonase/LRE family protein [Phenylobacterium sp.]|jgi:sugar lactone lactonase YvrE|uniref:SMP-30/gluconolactonase/LRE family protein n=1 Tax=Phenylobacterium sp. TaxID=1871053 RepID=UPI002F94415D